MTLAIASASARHGFGLDFGRDFLEAVASLLLGAEPVRVAEVGFAASVMRVIERIVLGAGFQSHSGLPASSTSW